MLVWVGSLGAAMTFWSNTHVGEELFGPTLYFASPAPGTEEEANTFSTSSAQCSFSGRGLLHSPVP